MAWIYGEYGWAGVIDSKRVLKARELLGFHYIRTMVRILLTWEPYKMYFF
jgi:hypothetical protein